MGYDICRREKGKRGFIIIGEGMRKRRGGGGEEVGGSGCSNSHVKFCEKGGKSFGKWKKETVASNETAIKTGGGEEGRGNSSKAKRRRGGFLHSPRSGGRGEGEKGRKEVGGGGEGFKDRKWVGEGDVFFGGNYSFFFFFENP